MIDDLKDIKAKDLKQNICICCFPIQRIIGAWPVLKTALCIEIYVLLHVYGCNLFSLRGFVPLSLYAGWGKYAGLLDKQTYSRD